MAPARKVGKKTISAKSPARKKEKAAAPPPAPEPRKKAPAKKARPARSKPTGPGPTVESSDRRSRLGAKWVCYSCASKFYDLNQPEPRCPKCGADQRNRPKDSAPPTPPPPPRVREPRPLALLDDDDAATRDTALTEDDLDLDIVGEFDDEDFAGEPGEIGLEEEEEPTEEE
jgi:hypothetical protein